MPRQSPALYSPVTKTVPSIKIKALLLQMPTFIHQNTAVPLGRNFQQLFKCSRKLTVTTTQIPHTCRCISQVVAYRQTQDSYSKLRDKTATMTAQLSSVTSGRVRTLLSSSRSQLFSRNVICYYREKFKKKFTAAFILAKCHRQISNARKYIILNLAQLHILQNQNTAVGAMWVTLQRSQHFDQALASVSTNVSYFLFQNATKQRANGVAHHPGKRLLEKKGKDGRKILQVYAPRTKSPTEDQSAIVAAAATLVTWQTYSAEWLVTLTSRLSRCISTRGPTWPKNVCDYNTKNYTTETTISVSEPIAVHLHFTHKGLASCIKQPRALKTFCSEENITRLARSLQTSRRLFKASSRGKNRRGCC